MKYSRWKLDSRDSEKCRYEKLCAAMQTAQGFLYLGRLAQRAAQLFEKRIALYCKGATVSFAHLYQWICAFSDHLRAQGIAKGDRVLLFYNNSIEFYVAYFAALQQGAIIAPVNVYLTQAEFDHIVNDAQPKAIIAGPLCTFSLDTMSCIIINHAAVEQAYNESGKRSSCEDTIIDRDPDEVAVLLYTSGTTGLPKAVMLSSRNVLTNIAQGIARLAYSVGDQDRIFGILPLFHSFAQLSCVWVPFFIGCSVIVVPKIDRKALLTNMSYRPTFFVGVPALYGLLCLLKQVPLDSVRLFICGGDALSDKIRMAFALLYGRKIAVGYGLTEASPLISCVVTESLLPVTAVGAPVPGLEASIRDMNGQRVESGVVGQLWVRGDNIMLGYYNDRAQTKTVLQDGWLKTGDLAYLDRGGRIFLAGRVKDLIIHKGFNIYPAEVENVLMGHPAVLRAAVIGCRKNDEEVPIAFIQSATQEDNLEAELVRYLSSLLAPYKVPKAYYISSAALPITATGKVDKVKLFDYVRQLKS